MDDTHLKVTARNGYIGPGAVTVQVMDGESATDEGAHPYVTIPVQVGPSTPVLRCPTAPISLLAGGDTRSLDIGTLRSVWAADPAGRRLPRLHRRPHLVPGVEATGGRTVQIKATSGAAAPGAQGRLAIGVAGSRAATQVLTVAIIEAPTATIQGRTFTDIQQGTPVRVPVGISSPLVDAVPGIVKVTQIGGPATPVRDLGHHDHLHPARRRARREVVFEVTGTDGRQGPVRTGRSPPASPPRVPTSAAVRLVRAPRCRARPKRRAGRPPAPPLADHRLRTQGQLGRNTTGSGHQLPGHRLTNGVYTRSRCAAPNKAAGDSGAVEPVILARSAAAIPDRLTV